MAHKFLLLKVLLIPWQTKKYVPTFWRASFSNDGIKGENGEYTTEPTYLLLDGRNEIGELVHPQPTFDTWLRWSDNPLIVQQDLIDSAIELTGAEVKSMRSNPDSLLYVEPEVLI